MAQVLRRRVLGRALLARQMLLERADATAEEAVTRLVGMQAQAPYFGLWSRLRKFGTAHLTDALTKAPPGAGRADAQHRPPGHHGGLPLVAAMGAARARP
ncbi:hypothetical protein [Micromonospora sp. WMMA1947]|uniref:hypothetical protein n=1 Tax=Micromonospora sp. WMMA1947 TaxID=3015163 RepID=UPI00248CBC28|nr:hypothetical protein [Micromonospora sp. WMMA1947]WBC07504.1 hypothetical protein O7604_20030 [Micromonospora sp. WMMA1947]